MSKVLVWENGRKVIRDATPEDMPGKAPVVTTEEKLRRLGLTVEELRALLNAPA